MKKPLKVYYHYEQYNATFLQKKVRVQSILKLKIIINLAGLSWPFYHFTRYLKPKMQVWKAVIYILK